MADLMDNIFNQCNTLRNAGQAEYAHASENAFANFERLSERMGISREAVLMVYAEKHIDGIHSYIQGHKSQREDVRGRIKDVIVYMCLLYGMVEDNGDKVLDPGKLKSIVEVVANYARDKSNLPEHLMKQDEKDYKLMQVPPAGRSFTQGILNANNIDSV